MLFSTLFKSLGPVSNENNPNSRRRHERRSEDVCIMTIGDKLYPVLDWSQGGVCIETDTRQFGMGQNAPFRLKFKTSSKIIDIDHVARVVRKTRNQVAFQFEPIGEAIKEQLDFVIADQAGQTQQA